MKSIRYFIYRRLRRLVPAWRMRPGGWLPDELLPRVEQRGLFIHIPKTAGNSVCQALYQGMKIYHRPAREIRFFHPLRYRHWFKFAVVRDPVERFLSSYDFLMRGGKNAVDAAFRDRTLATCPDINSFIQRLEDPSFRRMVMGYFHFRPQADYVTCGGRCIVNRLIPMERMNEEIPSLIGGATLPHVNVTQGHRTLASALSPENLSRLQQIYRRDGELHRLACHARGQNVFGRQITP